MNISDARKIPLSSLVIKLGGTFVKEKRKGELWYRSPLRDEKTASFKVDEQRNQWKDFGHHLPGGDIIDLYCDFHQKDRRDKGAINEALEALKEFDNIERIDPQPAKVRAYSERYQILKIQDGIKAKNLRIEIARRNISARIVEDNYQQAHVLDNETNRKIWAFALENDKEGHEINVYNPEKFRTFKTCIGPKALKTYPASPKAETVKAFVFSGQWDRLAWMHLKGQKQPDELHIVTNGDSLIGHAAQAIMADKRVKRAYGFMDHDFSKSGELAGHNLALSLEPEGIQYCPMDHLYTKKDLSEELMENSQGLYLALRAEERKYSYDNASQMVFNKSSPKPRY